MSSIVWKTLILKNPQNSISILPQLQDLKQQLEENGEDSREVILQVLSNIEETVGNR